MPTQSEIQLLNSTLFEQLGTPGMQKIAADAITDFTRVRMREDGILRRVLPPLSVSNDELTRQVDTDDPVVICEKEPDSPAAVSVPFGSLPINYYILGPRYRVQFNRILTPNFTKDVDQLRTWVMDIRQVMTDNAIKDMLGEEDNNWFKTVNSALIGQNQPTIASSTNQWSSIAGGITRDTLQDALKTLPTTPFHLEAQTVVINNVSIREILKWGRDEVGGDFAQDLLKSGWSEQEFMNVKWLVTIKRDLVPDNTIFQFAEPKFIGKFLELEPTTLYVKREFFMLSFFGYETIGCSIGHTGSLARTDFV